MKSSVIRLALLLLLGLLALQLYFAGRIALMTVLAPQSTTFQRTEIRRLLLETGRLPWSQQWVDREAISPHLRRAVIASEDAGFVEHGGVDWDAIEKAYARDQLEKARAEKRAAVLAKFSRPNAKAPPAPPQAKIVGGSTITQQLAKNLFLSGERSFIRKGQEFLITLMLEPLLGKQRILEIYLNNVEWGEGIYGAQAASRYYFRADASQLTANEAARLAVMLPAPKRFQKRPASPYIVARSATIEARMPAVELP